MQAPPPLMPVHISRERGEHKISGGWVRLLLVGRRGPEGMVGEAAGRGLEPRECIPFAFSATISSCMCVES